ncbi:TPA: restriction endonuclease subunit S [Acinetobacter baumannii]|jgi:type I restriction enzyme S subunit|uniref:restriction endonuclease subunit S n=1 Tax=Acinetobacter TaxID=469 RepID=UPI00338F97D6
MSQLPRYESYKDSGVQWLGEIPSHWDVKRMKFVVTNVGDKIDAKESDLRYFGLENIESFTGKLLDSVELESEGVGHRFQKDDVLFGKLRPYLAKVFLAQEEGLSSTEALVFRSSEVIYPKFLSYYCLSQDFINEVNGTTFGSKMPRASWDDISSFRMVYPSLDEQKIIADFLDKRLAQVDALIAKQEILLEKLAEQRVALISHAVTKGLNPDVEMKESTNIWLGKIPETWVLKPTKYFLSYVGSGKTPKGGSEVYIDEGIMMIRSQNVHDDGLRLEDVVHITDEADQGQINTRVYEDDVLLNITGASLGRVSLVPKGIPLANVNQHVCILRPIQNLILPEFLHLIMQSHYAKSLIKSEENGTSREGLTFEQIKAMVFALPLIDEQMKICEYIKVELGFINNSRDACNNLIGKLKEYRSTLITQVVTGKIDVRNIKVN